MATTPLPRRPALIGDEKLETEAIVFNYHFKTCLRKSLGGGGGGGGSVEQACAAAAAEPPAKNGGH